MVTNPVRIGVLGGTFDPVHWGHLVIAEEARIHFGLNRVLFVPAQDQWRKQGRRLSRAADRLAMVEAAVKDNPYFEVSTVDLERSASTYTVDTLQDLSGEHDLYFILGLDALMDLPYWKAAKRITELAWLVAALRPGYDVNWTALEKGLPDAKERVLLLTVPEIGISSTAIRQRVAEAKSIRYWVPEAVAMHISEHGLYRGHEQSRPHPTGSGPGSRSPTALPAPAAAAPRKPGQRPAADR